jgi:hypothetical protein
MSAKRVANLPRDPIRRDSGHGGVPERLRCDQRRHTCVTERCAPRGERDSPRQTPSHAQAIRRCVARKRVRRNVHRHPPSVPRQDGQKTRWRPLWQIRWIHPGLTTGYGAEPQSIMLVMTTLPQRANYSRWVLRGSSGVLGATTALRLAILRTLSRERYEQYGPMHSGGGCAATPIAPTIVVCRLQ